jgi:hypothetical protein
MNEDDLDERKHQVSLIRKILGQAKVVSAWLDEDRDGRLSALKSVFARNYADFYLTHEAEWPGRQSSIGVREEAMEISNAVAELRARPFWNGAWIIQELMLAQKVLVWLNVREEWDMDVALLWAEIPPVGKIPMPSYHTLFHVANLRRIRGGVQRRGYSLVVVIIEFRDTKCCDLRDKVYAFLTLSGDKDSNGVEADYSKSPIFLYFELVSLYPSYGSYFENSLKDMLSLEDTKFDNVFQTNET